MSKEMWEFDEDGEMILEKCVHGFLPELFQRWKEVGTNHVVSIVLFSRVIYPLHPNSFDGNNYLNKVFSVMCEIDIARISSGL